VTPRADAPPTDTRDVLVAVRDLIADPKAWTQRTYARDAHGRVVDECSDEACAWCLSGALFKVTDGGRGVSRLGAIAHLNECAETIGVTAGFVALNDATDHPTVLRTLDCAIAKASA
jgi:hypothetical protein